MKIICLFLVLVFNARAATDVRAFWWQESRGEKTGDNIAAFYIAPSAVMQFYEAIAARDDKKAERIAAALPKDAWSYVIGLRGEAATYAVEKIILREGTICGDFPKIESGTIAVDRSSSTVRISLKVAVDGKVIDFVGNGVHKWTKGPNKAPEPTP